MKKSITALAIIASSNAFANGRLPTPVPTKVDPNPQMSHFCFNVSNKKVGKKTLIFAGCDESQKNRELNRRLLGNGCAEDQVSLSFEETSVTFSCRMPVISRL